MTQLRRKSQVNVNKNQILKILKQKNNDKHSNLLIECACCRNRNINNTRDKKKNNKCVVITTTTTITLTHKCCSKLNAI